MFKKNTLTKNVKKFLILLDVNSSLLWNQTRLNVSDVLRQLILFVVPHKGNFCFSENNQNNYERSTTNSRQQKTSWKKLVNKMQIETIKQIISEFLIYVKRKFALPVLAHFKPKKRDFTEKDLKKLQNLFEKNNQNLQLAWKEFYQITGTNQNTFNN